MDTAINMDKLQIWQKFNHLSIFNIHTVTGVKLIDFLIAERKNDRKIKSFYASSNVVYYRDVVLNFRTVCI